MLVYLRLARFSCYNVAVREVQCKAILSTTFTLLSIFQGIIPLSDTRYQSSGEHSMNMSDSQASSVNSKEIDGTVIQNEDFKEANGKIWRRSQKPLGKGGYSQVYLYQNGRSKCAVKRIANISGGGRTDSAELEEELAALVKLSDHKRFVSFIGWAAYENIAYFALEYIQLGNLEENLGKRERTKKKKLEKGKKTEGTVKRADVCLPEAEVRTILTQILEGIEFMHAEGYIHRDLKPEVRHQHRTVDRY